MDELKDYIIENLKAGKSTDEICGTITKAINDAAAEFEKIQKDIVRQEIVRIITEDIEKYYKTYYPEMCARYLPNGIEVDEMRAVLDQIPTMANTMSDMKKLLEQDTISPEMFIGEFLNDLTDQAKSL